MKFLILILSFLILTGCNPDPTETTSNPDGIYLYDDHGIAAAIVTVTFSNPNGLSDIYISLKNISGRTASFGFQLVITNNGGSSYNYTSNNDIVNLPNTATFSNFINVQPAFLNDPSVSIINEVVVYTNNG